MKKHSYTDKVMGLAISHIYGFKYSKHRSQRKIKKFRKAWELNEFIKHFNNLKAFDSLKPSDEIYFRFDGNPVAWKRSEE